MSSRALTLWADVDIDHQVIRVRRQLSQPGELTEPKTANAKRDVVMFPHLAGILAEHKLASPFTADEDFVFCTRKGTPFLQGNVTKRGLRKATEAAKLDRPGEPKLHAHDLRHGFASMLIREGADPVFVSRQLGHANPGITMRVYAHLFDGEAQADRMRTALEARFGSAGYPRVTGDGDGRENTGEGEGANVAEMAAFRSRR